MSDPVAGQSVYPRTLLKRAFTLGRNVLLIAALLSLALAGLWVASPTSIDRVDALLKERHAAPLKNGIAAAKREIAAGNNAEAISLLEGLLARNKDVRNQDRLAAQKRKVFEVLAELHAENEDPERAMVTYERWLEFSPRDVTAATRYAIALYETDGRRAEGADQIRSLWRRFPDVVSVADAYIRLQIEAGEIDEAYRALVRYGNRNPELWRLMWDTGEGFQQTLGTRRAPSRLRGGRFAFDVAPPEQKATRLRVEAPGDDYFVIDAILEFNGDSVRREVVLDSPDVLASDDLRRLRQDVFRSGKEHGSSHWTLLAVGGHPAPVRFSADLVPVLPRAATELLATWPPPPDVAADPTYQLYRRVYPHEIEESQRKRSGEDSATGQDEAASNEGSHNRLERNSLRLSETATSQTSHVAYSQAHVPGMT